MRFSKKFLNSTVFNCCHFAYVVLNWFISIFLVRLSGFEDAGYFSLAISVSSFFVIIANYGLRTFQNSDSNKKYDDQTYIITRIITCATSFVLCFLYCIMAQYSLYSVTIIVIYMLFKVIEAYHDVNAGIWQNNNNILLASISLLIRTIAGLAFFFCSYMLTHNLLISIISLTISALIVSLTYDRKVNKKHIVNSNAISSIKKEQVISLLKIGFASMLSILLVNFFSLTPKLVIENQLGVDLLGVFSSLMSPTMAITTFATGVFIPLVPQIIKYYKQDTKKLIKLVSANILLFSGVGIFCLIISLFAGKPLFAFVFGKEILDYYNSFYLMIFISVFTSLVNLYTYVLVAIRKMKQLLIFTSISCVLNIFLTLLGAKAHGLYGVTFSFLLTIAVQFILESFYVFYVINKGRQCKNEKTR